MVKTEGTPKPEVSTVEQLDNLIELSLSPVYMGLDPKGRREGSASQPVRLVFQFQGQNLA
jgi:hypothetical protein